MAANNPAPTLCTYQLVIEVARPIQIVVGRLGQQTFPAGRYLYTGSAKSHIEARIARHLRKDKKCHWHIDYLLTQAGVRVLEVRRYTEAECRVNQSVVGTCLIPGFGASDCRQSCGSHLKYLGK